MHLFKMFYTSKKGMISVVSAMIQGGWDSNPWPPDN